MISSSQQNLSIHKLALFFSVLLGSIVPLYGQGQNRQNPYGEWRYQSGDAWGTRYSPVDQINGDNFVDLEEAWVWRADNFGPEADYQMKSTPTYIDGILYTVAGERRTVVALDPETVSYTHLTLPTILLV